MDDEAKVAPDFVIRMYSLFIQCFLILLYLFLCISLRMFLVKFLPTLVLFYLGASGSFTSRAFTKSFDDVPGALDHPVVVNIVDDQTIRVEIFYHDCIMEIYNVRFLIDIILILLGEISIVVGMNYLI